MKCLKSGAINGVARCLLSAMAVTTGMAPRIAHGIGLMAGVLVLHGAPAVAQPAPVESLPASMRTQLFALTPSAQTAAEAQLRKMGSFDAARTGLDTSGRFYFVEDPVPTALGPQIVSQGSRANVLTAAQPSGFTPEGVPIFHSLPGSSNVIYLNFVGKKIVGTAWNDNYGSAVYTALPYDLDGLAAFSASEQGAVAEIWARVAEDYAPWQIDVTTEAPPQFTKQTLEALITRHISAEGTAMPASNAGGIAYYDIFGYNDTLYYRPALIYYTNLVGGRADVVAEATSHELGHNFGLSHDGVIGGSAYWSGAGSGSNTWGAIMGAAYWTMVSKFSNGDYPNANNREDDLAFISYHLPLRADDAGNDAAHAQPITPSADGSYTKNGLMEWYTDVDAYSITNIAGMVIHVDPALKLGYGKGYNEDLAIEVLDGTGKSLVKVSPDDVPSASVSLNNLSPTTTYTILISSVSNPIAGYSNYGGMGQYLFNGRFTKSSVIKLRQVIGDWGYPGMARGWYDVQNQGVRNDYCRYVGTPAWFSCALAGSTNPYTPPSVTYNPNAPHDLLPSDQPQPPPPPPPVKPRQTFTDWGYAGMARGWYDVQNQGVRNDYCRYVGTPAWFSCALAGSTNPYTPPSVTYNPNAPHDLLPSDQPPPPPPPAPVKPRQTIVDWGYTWMARGWYDVQNQGVRNDYCRYVGTPAWFSCALAGSTNPYTPPSVTYNPNASHDPI